MLIMLAQRGIRPDLILFADTGGEKPETYAYMPVIQDYLASVGFPEVVTVRYQPTRTGWFVRSRVQRHSWSVRRYCPDLQTAEAMKRSQGKKCQSHRLSLWPRHTVSNRKVSASRTKVVHRHEAKLWNLCCASL